MFRGKHIAAYILAHIYSIISLFQPIMAFFRPAADHKKRYLFNMAHFSVGTVAHIISGKFTKINLFRTTWSLIHSSVYDHSVFKYQQVDINIMTIYG